MDIEKGINVLSLFDGCSGGQQALERCNIKVNNYYASEIDKYAIKVTMANYPNTIQLGSVIDVDVKLLCFSEVYSYLCTYDTNLQSKFSEQEVLYWINEEYTISTYFGTQNQNEGQAVQQHSILQCFEKIRITKCGMGDFIKTRNIKGCGTHGDKENIGNPLKLQCGEWWYGNDIKSRDTQTNIIWTKRKAKNGNLQTEDIGNPQEKISRRERTQTDFRENKKCNVDKESKGELFAGQEENKLNGKIREEEGNGRVETDWIIENIIRKLHEWNETNGTSETYRDFLRLHSQEQVTVVKYAGGLKVFKGKFDLIYGGSPCQSFSFAGKRKGMSTKDSIDILTLEHYLKLKSQKFEFEGQSYLFWEYIRILTDIRKCNPDVKFLLENVIMGAKWQKVLANGIGINPIEINSALVSAQNRRRLYFTNIGAEQDGLFGDLKCMIPQPKDKGILLKDILETEVDEKYYIKNVDKLLRLKDNVIDTNRKSHCFTAGGNSGGNHSDMDLIKIVTMRGRNPENTSDRTKGCQTKQMLEAREDGKTNCITTVQKDNLVLGCDYRTDEGLRFRDNGKSGTLAVRARNDESCGQLTSVNYRIRRLTPLECERLQCMVDFYTNYVSHSQRYKMIGNGWTIDVVSHIFNYLKK